MRPLVLLLLAGLCSAEVPLEWVGALDASLEAVEGSPVRSTYDFTSGVNPGLQGPVAEELWKQ